MISADKVRILQHRQHAESFYISKGRRYFLEGNVLSGRACGGSASRFLLELSTALRATLWDETRTVGTSRLQWSHGADEGVVAYEVWSFKWGGTLSTSEEGGAKASWRRRAAASRTERIH